MKIPIRDVSEVEDSRKRDFLNNVRIHEAQLESQGLNARDLEWHKQTIQFLANRVGKRHINVDWESMFYTLGFWNTLRLFYFYINLK